MMKNRTFFPFLIVFLALAVFITGRGHAAPAAQGGNLLQNPSFEQPFSNGVANNWKPWNMSTPRQDEECLVAYHYLPKWIVETNPELVRDGSASQHIGNNWDTWAGGVYQTVPATPGVTYRFSFYGRGRGTNDKYPNPSDTLLQMNMRAGIDPNGSGSWSDGDVVWGPAGSPHDGWQEFSVEATATGDQITVFTYTNWAVSGVNQCRRFLDIWVDAGQLVAKSPPPTAVPPTAAPLPTLPPAPPTEPPPTELPATQAPPTEPPPTEIPPTPTPSGGTICVNAFNDANANGLRDPGEASIGGVLLTIGQGTTVVGQVVSTGSETPVCFDGLAPGDYQVGQTLPAVLEMTTQANAAIQLNEGQSVLLEFGSRPRTVPTEEPGIALTEAAVSAAATATAAATPVSSGGGGAPSWLAYLGLAAVLVGVLLLGALVAILLRR
ncbi:MAG: hypothetical protein LC131_14650 [Anaerolineae bacterium]|nr:hypothetical protein [Anaerolineae bacterium]